MREVYQAQAMGQSTQLGKTFNVTISIAKGIWDKIPAARNRQRMLMRSPPYFANCAVGTHGEGTALVEGGPLLKLTVREPVPPTSLHCTRPAPQRSITSGYPGGAKTPRHLAICPKQSNTFTKTR
jgi:hypothetical protein